MARIGACSACVPSSFLQQHDQHSRKREGKQAGKHPFPLTIQLMAQGWGVIWEAVFVVFMFTNAEGLI